MEPLAVALLQHNKQFDTPAYISFRVGCDVWEYALLERVCLPVYLDDDSQLTSRARSTRAV